MTGDYERIAQAIDYLRRHRSAQPSLAEVARQVHLSEYHFQRLFCRWAGVTPKRYLQLLTLENAKILLREQSLSTLETSDALGLSSSSRLYDHFVQLDAVTPSQYRQRGKDLRIGYAYESSPYGTLFLAQTTRGICQLDFVDPEDPELPLARLRETWPRAEIREAGADASVPGATSILERLRGQAAPASAPPSAAGSGTPGKPLSLWVRGTNFQLSVWRALLRLHPGELASYSDIAAAVGRPTATRAVGSAIGANPVALIIPCHRVLRQDGGLGGYRWGETRKQAILARELAAEQAGTRHSLSA